MNKASKALYFSAGVAVAVTLLLVGMLAGGILLSPTINTPVQAAPLPQSVNGTDLVAAYEDTLVNVYQNVQPSVVNIRVAKSFDLGSLQGDVPEGHPEFFNQGGGSGFVWDSQGHIVTNNHVVEDASNIEVYFANGTWAEGEVVGTDPDSDLAVVKVDLPAGKLVPVQVGDSSAIEVGQLAIAIGNPFGQEFTMTSGIISGVGRTMRGGNAGFSIPEVIQTDAPINPGNSGGPLLNRQGEVIGINAQMLSNTGASSGIGFAIPVNIAKNVVPDLINGTEHAYSWLGISGGAVTPDLIDFRKLSTDIKGAVVMSVFDDSPAKTAGLVGRDESLAENSDEFRFGGDIITAINGTDIAGIDDLITYLVNETKPGDDVALTVVHADGSEETISVTLGSRPR